MDKFYIKRDGSGGLRRILSKLHWGLSTGVGSSTLKHKLSGFSIIQNVSPDSAVRIFSNTDPSKAYSNWFNSAVPIQTGDAGGATIISSNDSKIGFKGKAFSIPLKATVHVEFNRYRIGGGYSIEYTHFGPFVPISHKGEVNGFRPQVSSSWMKHYFGMLGAKVYRYDEYVLAVDAQIGGYKLGGGFNMGQIKKGLYYNLGVTLEREMSEYFRVFVRPSYEIKNYKLNMADAGLTIKHSFNTFYFNFGVTYRIPELRRCFLKDCHAQLNHAHGNKEYRSRRHPIYKKQNPHYGENYPVILKYKGRNKKKLNPY